MPNSSSNNTENEKTDEVIDAIFGQMSALSVDLPSVENGNDLVNENIEISTDKQQQKESKAEKKARHVLGKLNLERVHGVNQIIMRQKPDLHIVFNNPEVYVYKNALSDNYVIYGKYETRSAALDRMMWNSQFLQSQPITSNQEYLLNPEYAKFANNENQTVNMEESEKELSENTNEKDIELVMTNTPNCTRFMAMKALKDAKGDLVTAIMNLCV
ncbi:NAC domain-containing protein [Ditylenchus destructor]|nr:NAC domain-containing protein [Ditylenchus destructor]